ncbi:MAG: zinc-dependent metalloprotease [Acidimicrobiia bacterium]
MTAIPDPIDWDLAGRLAQRIAGRDPLESSYLVTSLQEEFTEITHRAEELVGDFTGLRPEAPATTLVLDRQGWVSANIASFRHTLEPLTRRVADRLAQSRIAPVGRGVAGAELGVLLGFLAQRVLGQYDLLVADPSSADPARSEGDAVYYVGPNILGLEKRFGFRPADFRLWIALHEVTHRAQFRAVPWMKPYFLSLVERSLEMIEPNPKRLVQVAERVAQAVRHGRNPLDDGGLISLFASDEQRGLIDQIQALMSLLEGHGNFVMDAVGATHVTGAERMSAVLSARRQSGGLSRQIRKLMGIEMKMRQYETGRRFLEEVEDQAGLGAVDVAWRGAEFLPTLDELEDPAEWLSRVGARTG